MQRRSHGPCLTSTSERTAQDCVQAMVVVIRPLACKSVGNFLFFIIFFFYQFKQVFVVVAFAIRSKHRLKRVLFIMISGKDPVVILVSALIFFRSVYLYCFSLFE